MSCCSIYNDVYSVGSASIRSTSSAVSSFVIADMCTVLLLFFSSNWTKNRKESDKRKRKNSPTDELLTLIRFFVFDTMSLSEGQVVYRQFQHTSSEKSALFSSRSMVVVTFGAGFKRTRSRGPLYNHRRFRNRGPCFRLPLAGALWCFECVQFVWVIAAQDKGRVPFV